MRADRGSETSLIMNAHWQLHQQRCPTIEANHTFMYGTSTANSRIESWWGQLFQGQIQKWRVETPFLFCFRRYYHLILIRFFLGTLKQKGFSRVVN